MHQQRPYATEYVIARYVMSNAIAIADAIAQLLVNLVLAQLGSTCSSHPHLGSTCLDLRRTLASDNLMVTPEPHMACTKLFVVYDPHLFGTPLTLAKDGETWQTGRPMWLRGRSDGRPMGGPGSEKQRDGLCIFMQNISL